MTDNDKIIVLIERLGRQISSEEHAAGLQPVQWAVLRYLHRANRFSRTAAAVTAYLGHTKGTVSQTLRTLETKGLIKKRVDGKDRRVNRLELTAAGKRLLREDPLTDAAWSLQDLSPQQHATMAAGLEQLLLARLDSQDRRPFGQCRDCLYFGRQHPDGQPHYCKLLETPLAEADSAAICFEQQPQSA